MRYFLTSVFLIVLLFPALALGGEIRIRYYENGQLRSKGTYTNGKIDSPWISYYANGQLRNKGTYKDRKKDGLCVIYNEDGTVNEYSSGTFKDG